MDQLAVDDSSPAGVSVTTAQQGHVGDWNINLAQNVLPGQARTVPHLIPQTSYQIRWEAVGYDPADVTPGAPTTITTTPPEVDASIQKAGDDGYIGQQVWSLDGDGETKSQWVKVGNAATYNIQVTNSEPYSDDFLIIGPGSDAKWTVSYFDAQGHDITAAVTGAGYTAHGLGVGQTCALSVEVAPNQGVADGDTKDVLVTATIGSDTDQADAVLATTMAVSQTIAKLQYSLDGQVTWNDVPQPGDVGYPLTVNQGDYVDFQAVKFDPNADWPADKPVWSGDGGLEGDVGEETWAYFDTYSHNSTDYKAVTAECYNSITANIRVNPKLSLAVWADGDSILAGGSPTALATTQLHAQVLDDDGNPVPGIIVSFSPKFDDNTQAGEINTPGTNDDQATTGADGIATVTLTSGRRTEDATITATATAPNGDALEDGTVVGFDAPDADVEFGDWQTVNGQQQQQVTITLSYSNIPLPARPIELQSTVTDANDNTVPDLVSLGSSSGLTDVNGVYTTYLQWLPTQVQPDDYTITVDVYDDMIDD